MKNFLCGLLAMVAGAFVVWALIIPGFVMLGEMVCVVGKFLFWHWPWVMGAVLVILVGLWALLQWCFRPRFCHHLWK